MKRYPLPDLLKGFAVFLIVPVHILELFIDYPGRESLFGKILLFLGGPIAVPVFMIVMGYFLAKNQKSFSTNFLRGVKVFVVGFLLNFGLNFHLLLKIKFAGWQYNSLEYIFGVDIFYFAGMSIILIAFLKKLKKGQAWLAFALVFFVIALTGFMNEKLMVSGQNYFLPFIAGTYSWSYFPLSPWLAYPLTGFSFFHFEKKIVPFFEQQKIISGIVITGILTTILYFSKSGFETTVNLSAYYHHTFLYSLWVFGIVILWAVFWRFILKTFPKIYAWDFFMWLGKNITLFYVIQWLIIGNISSAVYQTQSINRFVFWFAGIFSVTVLLNWLIGKTNIKLAR